MIKKFLLSLLFCLGLCTASAMNLQSNDQRPQNRIQSMVQRVYNTPICKKLVHALGVMNANKGKIFVVCLAMYAMMLDVKSDVEDDLFLQTMEMLGCVKLDVDELIQMAQQGVESGCYYLDDPEHGQWVIKVASLLQEQILLQNSSGLSQ